MPVRKHYILKILALLGILNLLWMIYQIITTTPDYTIVPVTGLYTVVMLFYVPLGVTAASILVFLTDLARYREKNWFAFFAAFIALLPYAIFIVGSLWFLR
jgi:hypothetical protein